MEIFIGVLGVLAALCLCDKLNIGNSKYGIIWIIITITVILFVASFIIAGVQTNVNTDVDFRY